MYRCLVKFIIKKILRLKMKLYTLFGSLIKHNKNIHQVNSMHYAPCQAIINTWQQSLTVKHYRTLEVDSEQSYSSYNEHRFIAGSVPVPDAQLCHALVNSNLTSKATSFDKFNAVEQQFKNKNKIKQKIHCLLHYCSPVKSFQLKSKPKPAVSCHLSHSLFLFPSNSTEHTRLKPYLKLCTGHVPTYIYTRENLQQQAVFNFSLISCCCKKYDKQAIITC